MKKFYLFLMSLLVCLVAKAQDGLPEFSTEDAPKWFSVEFKTGGAFLSDQGDGKNLITAADAEGWMFIGTKDKFTMKSKKGNYVVYKGSNFAATASATGATTLRLVEGSTEGTWEIQRTASSDKCMNQWGGTGAGKALGEWNQGDSNNPVYFNEMSDVVSGYIDPIFSDDTNEHYFMIQFAKNCNHLQSGGVGGKAVTAVMKNLTSQYWKFVGTADNFQLVSKDGSYGTIKSGTATNGQTGNLLHMVATPDAAGFRIEKSGNSKYSDAFEIRYNGTNSDQNTFNQWGGAEAGMSIGLWKGNNDDNNPLYIYIPEGDLVTPFEIEGISNYQPENALTLWYKDAASNTNAGDQWMEYSLPIGNGQFGASLFGGVAQEQIQFNEKTLWSGRSTDVGVEYGDYENFGSVYVNDISGVFGEGKPVKNYYRQLDLTNATGSVHYTSTDGSIHFTREYIASNPDQVVAMRFTADQAGQISLRFTMDAGRPGLRAKTTYKEGTATFGGALETISYKALLKVIPTGGEMTTDSKGIEVKGADEVMVILGGGTDFDAYSDTYVSNTAQLASTVEARVNDAAAKSWKEIYDRHVADYKSFFDRCSFNLAGAENTMPTDDLVKQYAKRSSGMEPYALMLEQIYFAYGRYLEISSSRGVDLPSNLQGIWNNSSEPAWNADIHSNINVQMNYWPAEPTNLSEMHMPFLNYIINMADSKEWKAYAAKAGQNEGWTCYTENNIFGGVGSFMHNYVIANAWYCTHLWQHYRYTLDKEFLKKAFPAMWTCSRFWILRLKKASDGTYECPNEYSPEHGPSQDGVAHAQQLVWDVLANTLAAAEILGDEANVSEELLAIHRDRLENLDKGLHKETYTGQWGTSKNGINKGDDLLREWKYSPYTAGADGHRHMSHLMCVYPFNQVTPSSPYFEAAVNSMKLRGDASTGWSMGWKINLWARVLDGDHAHDILELALRHHSVAGGGVYYNLYDSHSPFQIDGNFGACAGIAEMIMQSHCDTIQILPALPSVWKEGSMKGLKAIGDFTVDVTWAEGKATVATITSNQGQPLFINAQDIATKKVYVNDVEVTANVINDHTIQVEAKAGDVVVVKFGEAAPPQDIFKVVSTNPADEVEAIETIELTFNADVAGQFDPYSMTAMKFKKENSVAASVTNYVTEGKKLTISLSERVTEPGEYTLVIPEGLISRASDGKPYAGEHNFTVVAPPVSDPYLPLHNGTKTRTDRGIQAIALECASASDNLYELTEEENTQDFTNKTAEITFKVVAGEEVTPVVTANGSWVHFFAYIDTDANGFTADIDADGFTPTGDLVSYSFFNNNDASDELGWNSIGESITGDFRNKPSMPAFKAPAVPGTYRMRFKQDWCNIDPAGDADGKFGDFKENGGQIIDLLLEVTDAVSIDELTQSNDVKSIHDLSGRKITKVTTPGLYIINGKKMYVKK